MAGAPTGRPPHGDETNPGPGGAAARGGGGAGRAPRHRTPPRVGRVMPQRVRLQLDCDPQPSS
ncbi:MAG: hypothetical protein ACK5SI_16550, partial [Planctomycetia bacterium]